MKGRAELNFAARPDMKEAEKAAAARGADAAEPAGATAGAAAAVASADAAPPVLVRALRPDDDEAAIREVWIGGCESGVSGVGVRGGKKHLPHPGLTPASSRPCGTPG
eukprot:SAG31_NODE_2227_length_6148_cov_5.268309_6_plen_108_part_00